MSTTQGLTSVINPATLSTELRVKPTTQQPSSSGRKGFELDASDFVDAKFGKVKLFFESDKGQELLNNGKQAVFGLVGSQGPFADNTALGQGLNIAKSIGGEKFALGADWIKFGAGALSLGLKGFGPTKYKFNADMNTLGAVGGDYMQTANDLLLANGNSYTKTTINNFRRAQQSLKNMAQNASDTMQIATNTSDLKHVQYLQKIDGTNLMRQPSYKQGGQLDWSPTYSEPEWLPIYSEPVELFKEGGKTELKEESQEESNQKSIIPEGALHAHKHHMEDDENITKKGIPVVDMNGEQQAEIERDEVIFNLTLTNKLEELYKEFYDENTKLKRKDELAIEAGKLITCEIITNLDDRTGLVDKCEKGGKL